MRKRYYTARGSRAHGHGRRGADPGGETAVATAVLGAWGCLGLGLQASSRSWLRVRVSVLVRESLSRLAEAYFPSASFHFLAVQTSWNFAERQRCHWAQ